MKAPIYKKEIPLQFWQQPEKNIDDNLQPAIDLLHSWGLKSLATQSG
jgi:hypothetical protein